jgi:RHS repeat-associated protein
MPGSNLSYAATYNSAGQVLNEWNTSSGSFARSNNYSYFASGSPFAGLLQTRSDGRSVSCAYAYDSWLRATNFAYTGASAEQNLTTTLQYEPRGFLTNVIEQFTGTNTIPAVSVQRSYDVYSQLASESVNDGSFGYGDSQTWDASGRRTQLNLGAANYGFGWQADGRLIAANDSTGGGVYGYNTAGLLNSRAVGNRQTAITSRDGEGRPISINTTLNAVMPELNETNVWSGDGLLLSHTLWRGDFGTDNRAYAYASGSRRLTQEQLNVSASTTWTNTFAYDNGAPRGPGVLTAAGQNGASSPQWSGMSGAFSRVSASTNTLISLSAYGHTIGLVTLSGWLDNQPVPVTGIASSYGSMAWRAPLQLTPGTHQLTMAAQMQNGLYTVYTTNVFTNTASYQAATDYYDAAGNITNRVWLNPSGGIDRVQTLSWDARGRLHAVTERDANTNGYNWTATYDGLNRRLSTTSLLVSNGVAFTSSPTVINSYYDPQVEFLELGVNYGSATEFKLYGPDLNGVYGALNGVGGLDAISPILNLFWPTISDERGNILGVETNGVAVSWNPARPTGYSSVPGYQPLPLANGANISLASAWRGRWADITGLYNVGMRPYDPVSGRWMTFDSVWNEVDPNGMTFCGGDPINRFDSDGRLSSSFQNFQMNGGIAGYALNGIGNALNSYSGDNAFVGGYGAYLGTLFNEAGGAVSPSTYVNGLSSFGNNIGTVYNDSGLLPAISYGATSWNVGAVWSGAANINLATGEPVGDWWQRGEDISGGVASTALISAGGVSAFNWATAPATTAPAAAAPETTTLYRVVTDPELDSINNSGQFSTVPGSSTPVPGVQGKWFYQNLEDAQNWAGQAAAQDGGPLTIVQTTVPRTVAPVYSQPWVDSIQNPAEFYNIGDLNAPIKVVSGPIK